MIATVPHDLRLIDVKAHAFAVGMVTLTCPCGWSETQTRLDAPGVQAAHAAACAACQVNDPDAGPLLALTRALDLTPGVARAALRALRADGYDLTPKDLPL